MVFTAEKMRHPKHGFLAHEKATYTQTIVFTGAGCVSWYSSVCSATRNLLDFLPLTCLVYFLLVFSFYVQTSCLILIWSRILTTKAQIPSLPLQKFHKEIKIQFLWQNLTLPYFVSRGVSFVWTQRRATKYFEASTRWFSFVLSTHICEASAVWV